MGAFEEDFERYVKKGRAILKNLSIVQQNIPVRRFKGREITSRLLVNLDKVYKDDESGVLPVVMERDTMNRRLGYTLEEMNLLQEYYNSSPRKAETESAVTLAFTNQKGGCWKSTTALHSACDYANLGYRVLVLDLDPQASSTEAMGFMPNVEISVEDTLAPFLELDDEFPIDNVRSVVRKTYNCNVDIIPSCLGLGYTDFTLTQDMARASSPKDIIEVFTRLRAIIDELKMDYDIIICDGTPSLGLLPINIVVASDIVITPTPTEITDFGATIAFCDLILTEFKTIKSHIGDQYAEGLFPTFMFLPTRYSSSSTLTVGSEEVLHYIKNTFEEACMKSYVRKHDSVISNLAIIRRTIFDIPSGVINTLKGPINIKSAARKKAMTNYEEVNREILENTIKPFWPSKESELLTEAS